MDRPRGGAVVTVLTPELAQQIAGETSAIIGLNVLITDVDGTVIGSGDTSRVGSFHEASVEVVRTVQPAAHDPEQARALRGVLPGTTLPIVLDGKAVGTVGITGSPALVSRFGQVVKRQTEILLQESVLLRSRLLRERAIEDLFRDIAYFDAEVVGPDFVAFRASELGYDLALPRRAVLVDLPGVVVDAALLRTIRSAFGDPQDITGALASHLVVLYRIRAGDLRKRCAELELRGLPATVGIGAVATTVAGLRESYEDALSALRLGAIFGEGSVHAIEDVRVGQLLSTVPQRARTRFTGALAGRLREQADWPVLRETTIAWCESGFNLVRAAAGLHIHKNTLLYRLEKISQLAGTPAREPRACLPLYLACVADQLAAAETDV
jgi:carbohydrate diacid regulator